MDHPPIDHEQREGAQQPRAAVRQSRVGSAVKVALAAILGTGTVGGVGYTVHRQNELEQRNGVMEQKLTKEQMLREGIQRQLAMQEQENGKMRTTLSEEQTLREGIQRRLDTQVTLDDMDDAVEMVAPATVKVRGPLGHGSGVIITIGDEVYVLTNGHVTEGNAFYSGGTDWNAFRDAYYEVSLYTGNDFRRKEKGHTFEAYPVQVGGGKRAHSYSDKRDLSLLHIPKKSLEDMKEKGIVIPRIAICNRVDHPLMAGDRVIAIGNPFDEHDHVTDGIVSNSDAFGDIEPENVFIRTSAPINPGNSGGGLFRVRRENGKLITELVGINTWGYKGGDGVSGSIDIRVVALQCHEWGVPIVSDEEISAYQRWWKEEIEPWQKKWQEEQKKGWENVPPAEGGMPPADD